MTLIPPTFRIPLGLRATIVNGAQFFPSGTDDVRQLAEAIQHLASRLAAAEHALEETHDRCSCCGGWIPHKEKAFRLRIDYQGSTSEPSRTLAYHGRCLEEQDPEEVENIISDDAEKIGGEHWVPASDLPRLHAIRASLLRGLREDCFLYSCTLDLARSANHLPREWMR